MTYLSRRGNRDGRAPAGKQRYPYAHEVQAKVHLRHADIEHIRLIDYGLSGSNSADSIGRLIPLNAEEIRPLVKKFPGARIERCSPKDGDLDFLVRMANGQILRLALHKGRLWTNNPDDTQIKTMIDIARCLGARVRGDEFETFRTPLETFIHPEDKVELQRAEDSARHIKMVARRKQWLLNAAIILIFSSLAVVVIYMSRR